MINTLVILAHLMYYNLILQCELIILLLSSSSSSSSENKKKPLIILHQNQQQPVTTAGADGQQTVSWCELLFRTNYAF